MSCATRNIIFGVLAAIAVLSAAAQEAEISYFQNDRSARMRCGQAYDGFLLAWEKATTINVRPGTEGGPKEGILTQERIHCLLNDFLQREATGKEEPSVLDNELHFALLVLGPEAMDMVSRERDSLSGMTQYGVDSWLLGAGHPSGIATMIDNRRKRLEETHGAQETPSAGFAAVISPIIYESKCAVALCSPRINESVKLLAENLELVEQELRGIERWAQRTGDSQGMKITARTLELVHDCQAGRAHVGSAKKTE